MKGIENFLFGIESFINRTITQRWLFPSRCNKIDCVHWRLLSRNGYNSPVPSSRWMGEQVWCYRTSSRWYIASPICLSVGNQFTFSLITDCHRQINNSLTFFWNYFFAILSNFIASFVNYFSIFTMQKTRPGFVSRQGQFVWRAWMFVLLGLDVYYILYFMYFTIPVSLTTSLDEDWIIIYFGFWSIKSYNFPSVFVTIYINLWKSFGCL